MRRLNAEEVKKIQLEILDVVASFCEENNINYWLDSGTLLGAIRHKGYIPWDDDIDLGMLRKDYDRFAELFNKTNERYRFVDIENTPDFYVAFGKIIDTKTVLYEPDQNGDKLAVNIDLFVYDNAPDDDRIVRRMYRKRDRLRTIALFSRRSNILEKDSVYNRLLKRSMHLICKPFSSSNCIKKIIKNAKSYNCLNTKRVGNFTSITIIACDKALVNDCIDREFEGKMYKVPIGYDGWLRSFFGNYMELPPVEQRVTHHQYEAYWID